ncbi:MAG: hypothetical protein QOF52_2688 [Propionibacteriaceae bacterium]|jgi:hypothetical protein|nr:hypothetical protein [Propionibacteriaceae bacterium]MDX6322830.1 hypothetical protein [Propionibacteriaceae bacterium]
MSQSLPPAGPPQFRAPVGYGQAGPRLQGSQWPVHAQVGWQPVPQPPQRPGTVGLAATLAVTASLQWICVLAFAWLVALAATEELSTSGVDGVIFHMMNRFGYRMIEGLAWPLFGLPLAATVFGLALLGRRPWSRIGFTVAGAAALTWSAWWLQGSLLFWIPVASYILIACVLVWTPTANRWFGWRSAPAV